MKGYHIKQQKDKDIALRLAIQRLESLKHHIDEEIFFLKNHIGNKKHRLETFEGSNKIWITEELTY